MLKPGICILLFGRLDFAIRLSEMHIMSKFRFKLESRSFTSVKVGRRGFTSLRLELSEEMLRCNTVKSCFVTTTLLKSLFISINKLAYSVFTEFFVVFVCVLQYVERGIFLVLLSLSLRNVNFWHKRGNTKQIHHHFAVFHKF